MTYHINGRSVFVSKGVSIGDLVKITNFGHLYTTYYKAFEYFWGSKHDDFHDSKGHLMKPNYWDKNSFIKNIWKVVNIAKHGTQDEFICHLCDYYGRNLVMGLKGLTIIREGKKRKTALTLTIIDR